MKQEIEKDLIRPVFRNDRGCQKLISSKICSYLNSVAEVRLKMKSRRIVQLFVDLFNVNHDNYIIMRLLRWPKDRICIVI